MRHAQDYWLKLQAEKAIDIAARRARAMLTLRGVPPSAVCAAENWIAALDKETKRRKKTALEKLKEEHQSVIREASDLLVRAEILHREIVRRGGKV